MLKIIKLNIINTPAYNRSYIFLAVCICMAVLWTFWLPNRALAEEKVQDIALTDITSTDGGATVDIELGMVTAESISGAITFRGRQYNVPDPSNSGLDFTNANVTAEGLTGTVTVFPGGSGILFNPTGDLSAGTYALTISDVALPAEAVCLQVVTSTDSFLGPNTEYAVSNYMSIDGADGCDTLNKDLTDDGEEDVPDESDAGALSLTTFGTNADVNWDDYTEASQYALRFTEVALGDAGRTVSDLTTEVTQLVTGLKANTDYRVTLLDVDDVDSPRVIPYESVAFTTGEDLTTVVFTTPEIRKKMNRSFVVNYKSHQDSITDTERAYVTKYVLVVKNKKRTRVLRRFKNVSTAKNTQKVNKKNLRPNGKYRIRMRAVYSTGEKTQWSSYVKANLN